MEIVEQFRLSTFCCICKLSCSRGRERTTNSGRIEGSIILQVAFLQIIVQSLGHFVRPFRKWFLEVTVGTKWTTPCARGGKTIWIWLHFLCSIWFEVTCAFREMWAANSKKRHNFKKSYEFVLWNGMYERQTGDKKMVRWKGQLIQGSSYILLGIHSVYTCVFHLCMVWIEKSSSFHIIKA